MVHLLSGMQDACDEAASHFASTFSNCWQDINCTKCLENIHHRLSNKINELKGIEHDSGHKIDYGPYCLTCQEMGRV
jgi:hypothetical protein